MQRFIRTTAVLWAFLFLLSDRSFASCNQSEISEILTRFSQGMPRENLHAYDLGIRIIHAGLNCFGQDHPSQFRELKLKLLGQMQRYFSDSSIVKKFGAASKNSINLLRRTFVIPRSVWGQDEVRKFNLEMVEFLKTHLAIFQDLYQAENAKASDERNEPRIRRSLQMARTTVNPYDALTTYNSLLQEFPNHYQIISEAISLSTRLGIDATVYWSHLLQLDLKHVPAEQQALVYQLQFAQYQAQPGYYQSNLPVSPPESFADPGFYSSYQNQASLPSTSMPFAQTASNQYQFGHLAPVNPFVSSQSVSISQYQGLPFQQQQLFYSPPSGLQTSSRLTLESLEDNQTPSVTVPPFQLNQGQTAFFENQQRPEEKGDHDEDEFTSDSDSEAEADPEIALKTTIFPYRLESLPPPLKEADQKQLPKLSRVATALESLKACIPENATPEENYPHPQDSRENSKQPTPPDPTAQDLKNLNFAVTESVSTDHLTLSSLSSTSTLHEGDSDPLVSETIEAFSSSSSQKKKPEKGKDDEGKDEKSFSNNSSQSSFSKQLQGNRQDSSSSGLSRSSNTNDRRERKKSDRKGNKASSSRSGFIQTRLIRILPRVSSSDSAPPPTSSLLSPIDQKAQSKAENLTFQTTVKKSEVPEVPARVLRDLRESSSPEAFRKATALISEYERRAQKEEYPFTPDELTFRHQILNALGNLPTIQSNLSLEQKLSYLRRSLVSAYEAGDMISYLTYFKDLVELTPTVHSSSQFDQQFATIRKFMETGLERMRSEWEEYYPLYLELRKAFHDRNEHLSAATAIEQVMKLLDADSEEMEGLVLDHEEESRLSIEKSLPDPNITLEQALSWTRQIHASSLGPDPRSKKGMSATKSFTDNAFKLLVYGRQNRDLLGLIFTSTASTLLFKNNASPFYLRNALDEYEMLVDLKDDALRSSGSSKLSMNIPALKLATLQFFLDTFRTDEQLLQNREAQSALTERLKTLRESQEPFESDTTEQAIFQRFISEVLPAIQSTEAKKVDFALIESTANVRISESLVSLHSGRERGLYYDMMLFVLRQLKASNKFGRDQQNFFQTILTEIKEGYDPSFKLKDPFRHYITQMRIHQYESLLDLPPSNRRFVEYEAYKTEFKMLNLIETHIKERVDARSERRFTL